ncbi:hypothetical protein Tco_0928484 [Tanacetum coccineum]
MGRASLILRVMMVDGVDIARSLETSLHQDHTRCSGTEHRNRILAVTRSADSGPDRSLVKATNYESAELGCLPPPSFITSDSHGCVPVNVAPYTLINNLLRKPHRVVMRTLSTPGLVSDLRQWGGLALLLAPQGQARIWRGCGPEDAASVWVLLASQAVQGTHDHLALGDPMFDKPSNGVRNLRDHKISQVYDNATDADII